MRFKALIFTGIIVLLACVSCRRETPQPYWETDILVPLLKSEMTIGNIIPDSLITTNPDNSLNLSYNSTFYSLTMDSLFNIPDTTVVDSFLLPFGTVNLNPGDGFIPLTTIEEQAPIGSVELVRTILRNGYIDAYITNSIPKRLKITLTMPYATKNSQPFVRNIIVPAGWLRHRSAWILVQFLQHIYIYCYGCY